MGTRDKNIWLYNSGMSFSGNPKWMFLYMKKFHPEVKGVWLCYDRKTVRDIRGLGYSAHLFKSPVGRGYMKKAGVYVVNQVKEKIQPELKGITMLNLWHGVGCKTVEQKVDFGFLQERIYKKYIENNEFYRNNQLFLVTSKLMEEHFIKQCGLKREQLIRSTYPCVYPMDFVSCFDHDIRNLQKVDKTTRIAMYCPTYRDGNANDFFGRAIPDMDRLVEKLKETDTLLIFKLHPQMEKDYAYNVYKEKYKSCKWIMFWDNRKDIYEIFNQIDLAIVDYSSIFYDLLAAGVKNFVRYMFDLHDENNLRDFVFDVKEMTCGKLCENFDELIDALAVNNGDEKASDEETARIKELFWEYGKDSTPEDIYKKAMEFTPTSDGKKTLYSFDVFDTLIQRKCLSPVGVFAYVKQKMCESNRDFPEYLVDNYRSVRRWCEENVRDYYRKTRELSGSFDLEICFDEIFDRMAEVYKLDVKQISLLKEWELEGEYVNCIPCEEMIEKLKALLKNNETVVLISDMYLPSSFVKKLLKKADPILEEIPLFLSSSYKVQKSTKRLYLEVFKSFETYDFTEWVHFGDNPKADGLMPKQLGIKTVNHDAPAWEPYEQKYLQANGTFDAYRCAALMRRFKETVVGMQMTEEEKERTIFAYCYVSTWLVPYVAWSINDAIKNNIKCLYFISRDGYLLKKIADEIIKVKGIKIKTKYIYGSRKAWRIPSFVDKVDDEFFSPYGNIAGVKNFKTLLSSMHISEEAFDRMFSDLAYVKDAKNITDQQLEHIRNTALKSEEYKEYLLKCAKEERKIVVDYLRQEIDFSEKFAFVEYWGRGYTQECLGRLLDCAINVDGNDEANCNTGLRADNIFYYLRSIYFDEKNLVRKNFMNAQLSLIMVEAVFADMPYLSVDGYKYDEEGKVRPVMRSNPDYDKILFEALEKYLPQFAADVYSETILDEETFNKELCYFGLNYYKTNKSDPMFVNVLAKLKDSVNIYGKRREFAPPITLNDVAMKMKYNDYMRTKAIDISLERSNPVYRLMFKSYRKYKELRNKK